MSSPDICIEMIRGPDLDPYLPHLFPLINEAFRSQERSAYNDININPFPDWQRLKTIDQLKLELGERGLVAMAFDESHGYETRRPVAITCLKPWSGRVVVDSAEGDLEKLSLGPLDWEVATSASQDDARYRGRGLVGRCLDVLLQHVRASCRGGPLTLWISALDGVGSVEYWERRGFSRRGDGDLASAGTWGAVVPFRIVTLKKVIA